MLLALARKKAVPAGDGARWTELLLLKLVEDIEPRDGELEPDKEDDGTVPSTTSSFQCRRERGPWTEGFSMSTMKGLCGVASGILSSDVAGLDRRGGPSSGDPHVVNRAFQSSIAPLPARKLS